MISGSKGQKAVRACTIRLLNLGPAKHDEAAIYAVNQRIPNALELRELFYSGAIRYQHHLYIPYADEEKASAHISLRERKIRLWERHTIFLSIALIVPILWKILRITHRELWMLR